MWNWMYFFFFWEFLESVLTYQVLVLKKWAATAMASEGHFAVYKMIYCQMGGEIDFPFGKCKGVKSRKCWVYGQ